MGVINIIKSYLVPLICLILCMIVTNYALTFEEEEIYLKQCREENIVGDLIDINDDKESPPRGKSIFFHETSCYMEFDHTLMINPRQACAVESAARFNPNRTVYLLYTYPIRYPKDTKNCTRNHNLYNKLLGYDNIKIRSLNFKKYISGTPMDNWNYLDNLNPEEYAIVASDVLRYLTLWKYGGTYMDLDVVVMKNLDDLGNNYAGSEEDESVNNAVLHFDHNDVGHKLAEDCLREIRENYKYDRYDIDSLQIVTKVLQEMCTDDSVHQMSPRNCQGFKVLNPSLFYPVGRNQWKDYFNPLKLQQTLVKVKKSYLISLWNKYSKEKQIYIKGEPGAYAVLAEKFCPSVYRTVHSPCNKMLQSNHFY